MAINVDFSALDDCLRKMRAKPVEIILSKPISPIDPIDIQLEKGIVLPDLQDIEIENDLIIYKGRQILIYIQDHGGKIQETLNNGQKGNKFHVA